MAQLVDIIREHVCCHRSRVEADKCSAAPPPHPPFDDSIAEEAEKSAPDVSSSNCAGTPFAERNEAEAVSPQQAKVQELNKLASKLRTYCKKHPKGAKGLDLFVKERWFAVVPEVKASESESGQICERKQ
eukprot:TRINITY_DN105511_c0_g1_i1.p1 TRINITY_DN105511_c0_g1~~TRINITY_DN105511_c0_g1_i1.p1  ORF type:complete len:148 (+),score=23.72 TRINITY_DN105511_c0_g1_i1:57-446(+)